MKKLFLLFLFYSASCLSNEILFQDDFENGYESKVYQYLKAHGHDAVIVTNKMANNSRSLKIRYVSNYKGSTRVKGFFNLSKKVTAASLSYDVIFHDDFQFVKGGKMHGVGPDHVVTGDWKLRPDGWSSRIMWCEDGGVETVLVLQNKGGKWGYYHGNDEFKFKRGRRYSVTLYTKLNSKPDNKDGEVKVFVDGQLLIHEKRAQFYSDPKADARISQFLFSTFHGGGNRSWAPKDENGNLKDVHATFDNFEVVEGLKISMKKGSL